MTPLHSVMKGIDRAALQAAPIAARALVRNGGRNQKGELLKVVALQDLVALLPQPRGS